MGKGKVKKFEFCGKMELFEDVVAPRWLINEETYRKMMKVAYGANYEPPSYNIKDGKAWLDIPCLLRSNDEGKKQRIRITIENMD